MTQSMQALRWCQQNALIGAMLLCLLPHSCHASVAATWTSQNANSALQWSDVTFAYGKFVAVALSGEQIIYSGDEGTTWTAVNTAGPGQWTGVTSGDNYFVAVAKTGSQRVLYASCSSTDASCISIWHLATAPEANSWQSVAYGAGIFVAVASDGVNRVMTSTTADMNTWSIHAGHVAAWQDIAYGASTFVAVAASGSTQVMSSTTGTSWTTSGTNPSGGCCWSSVTYGNGVWVAVADNAFMTAPSGNLGTWTYMPASLPVDRDWHGVAYGTDPAGTGVFVAVGCCADPAVMESLDGTTWTANAPTSTVLTPSDGWQGVAFGKGTFVAVSDATSGSGGVMVATAVAPSPTAPTNAPSGQPSSEPSAQPTDAPSSAPSAQPSSEPSAQPTDAPSNAPTNTPTSTPTNAPTTYGPTNTPSNAPTNSPSNAPTNTPSNAPTNTPSNAPSNAPTNAPTTYGPTNSPTNASTTIVVTAEVTFSQALTGSEEDAVESTYASQLDIWYDVLQFDVSQTQTSRRTATTYSLAGTAATSSSAAALRSTEGLSQTISSALTVTLPGITISVSSITTSKSNYASSIATPAPTPATTEQSMATFATAMVIRADPATFDVEFFVSELAKELEIERWQITNISWSTISLRRSMGSLSVSFGVLTQTADQASTVGTRIEVLGTNHVAVANYIIDSSGVSCAGSGCPVTVSWCLNKLQ